MNETLQLVRDRIARKECMFCGKLLTDDYKVIIDEYILPKDAIKICKTHKTLDTDSEQQ